MTAYSNMQYNSIWMINTISASDDGETGSKLRDILTPLASKAGIHFRYNDVVSRKQLFDVLADVVSASKSGTIPILHIEAHGDKSGLLLSMNNVIKWEELREILTQINIYTRVNLLCIMALCSGYYLASILRPTHPAPVLGLIGPSLSVWSSDLLVALIAFYEALFATNNLDESMLEMNKAIPIDEEHYILETAELMLSKVEIAYRERECSPAALLERENMLVNRLARGRSGLFRRQVRKSVKARLNVELSESAFLRRKRKFLMLNMFPENESRFPISLEDCYRLASKGRP